MATHLETYDFKGRSEIYIICQSCGFVFNQLRDRSLVSRIEFFRVAYETNIDVCMWSYICSRFLILRGRRR